MNTGGAESDAQARPQRRGRKGLACSVVLVSPPPPASGSMRTQDTHAKHPAPTEQP